MGISASSHLSTLCCYFAQGTHCVQGFLYRNRKPDGSVDTDGVIAEPVKIEGVPIQCPACEGKGRQLTMEGRELIMFVQTYLRPFLYEMIEEAVEDKL